MKRAFLTAAMIGVFSFGCDGGGDDGCDPPCGDSQACCDGACVFTISSATNCGGCGIVCPSGRCNNGVCAPAIDSGPVSDCRPECTMNQRCCGTRCVDRAVPQNTDGRANPSFENCNGCGIACDPERALSCSIPGGGTTGTSRCMCGDFDQCLAGEVCVNNGGSYGCVSLSTDPRNCGAIGNACAEGESCSGGMCVCGATGGRCGDGEACCGGACVDTQTDGANCGGCGNICGTNAPNCMAGACICAASGRACDPTAPSPIPGFPGGSLGESCCPDVGCVANSDTSCGCTACSGGDECVAGGSGFFGGGGDEVSTVCCGDPFTVVLLGCGGFPFDAGFPIPGDDGGVPSDAGTSPSDAGSDAGASDAGGSMDAGAAPDAGMDAGA